MLFTSLEFILLFLPITVLVYWGLKHHQLHTQAILFLALASVFFYGFQNPEFLFILLTSIIINYSISRWITITQNQQIRWLITALGTCFNLGLLSYYKYANFFLANISEVITVSATFESIALPLGISFFTFQQIAFLIDTYQDKISQQPLFRYGLFVAFFPQLIAGPIVHHKEMMPQFSKHLAFKYKYIAIGLTLFGIGLFKKIALADNLAVYSTNVFTSANNGQHLSTLLAWQGALAYTLQLYFDFSAYSEMAMGIAKMFGIDLPINFNSPYKATSIIDFWRRWHMTLSRFLKDYLYIPLGGNRHGKGRRYINLLITMLLGGLWHGAGWNFIIWGGLHGAYLITNHAWRYAIQSIPISSTVIFRHIGQSFGLLITFIAVVFAWVFFRAETLDAAWNITNAMLNISDLVNNYNNRDLNSTAWMTISAGLLIVFLLPNTHEFIKHHNYTNNNVKTNAQPTFYLWQPNTIWACLIGVTLGISFITRNSISEFLYWQF